MKSGNYDISVDQGSTFVFHLTYQDSAGTAIDLSSYSASMQVRRSTIDTDLLLDIYPKGPIFIGGNCQAAPISEAMAHYITEKTGSVPFLITFEIQITLMPNAFSVT